MTSGSRNEGGRVGGQALRSNLSRRTFLEVAAGAMALSGVQIATAGRAGAATGGSAALNRSTFTPLLHSTFRTSDGTQTIAVVLSEITDLVPAIPAQAENQFALVFRAPAGQTLTSGLHRFDHSALGTVSLFVAPIDRRGTGYEAVINHPS